MSDINLIKPLSVKLRRLSKDAIKLCTTPKPSTSYRVQLNLMQTFIPVKSGKTSNTSALTGTGKQSKRKQPGSKKLSGRKKIYHKLKRSLTSPVLSSRVTRAQKI